MDHKPSGAETQVRHAGKNQSAEDEIARMAAAMIEVSDEIDSASQEGSSLEDIEGAKVLAADVLGKYAILINRLGPEDAKNLQQTIGERMDRIKKGLIKLKEAPE